MIRQVHRELLRGQSTIYSPEDTLREGFEIADFSYLGYNHRIHDRQARRQAAFEKTAGSASESDGREWKRFQFFLGQTFSKSSISFFVSSSIHLRSTFPNQNWPHQFLALDQRGGTASSARFGTPRKYLLRIRVLRIASDWIACHWSVEENVIRRVGD